MTRLAAIQVIFFRISLAAYLLYYIVMMFPHAGTLLGAKGVFRGTKFHANFPNLFSYAETASHVQLMIIGIGLCCTLMALGYERRVMALLVWYGWASVMGQSAAFHFPTQFYIGCFLWMFVLMPKGEGMPTTMFKLGWVIAALSYSYSGYLKWGDETWKTGKAFEEILNSSLVRQGEVVTYLKSLNIDTLQLLTHGYLGFELLFAILAVGFWSAGFAWIVMTAIHVGALFVFKSAEITVGLLLVHVFLFDVRWLSTLEPYFRRRVRIPEVYR